MSFDSLPTTTLLAECSADRLLWVGCFGFGVLLVIRASTSLCFAFASFRCRSAAGKLALIYVCIASLSLHLVRRVFPFVPISTSSNLVAAAQIADTAGISGVSGLIVADSWLGGIGGASSAVLIELLVHSSAGSP